MEERIVVRAEIIGFSKILDILPTYNSNKYKSNKIRGNKEREVYSARYVKSKNCHKENQAKAHLRQVHFRHYIIFEGFPMIIYKSISSFQYITSLGCFLRYTIRFVNIYIQICF